MSTLLEVNNLKTYFFRKKQPIPAVDGVDFHINKGETVALVGESGSGKSITSLSIMGLVQSSGGKIMDGSIKLEGRTWPPSPKTNIAKSAEMTSL